MKHDEKKYEESREHMPRVRDAKGENRAEGEGSRGGKHHKETRHHSGKPRTMCGKY